MKTSTEMDLRIKWKHMPNMAHVKWSKILKKKKKTFYDFVDFISGRIKCDIIRCRHTLFLSIGAASIGFDCRAIGQINRFSFPSAVNPISSEIIITKEPRDEHEKKEWHNGNKARTQTHMLHTFRRRKNDNVQIMYANMCKFLLVCKPVYIEFQWPKKSDARFDFAHICQRRRKFCVGKQSNFEHISLSLSLSHILAHHKLLSHVCLNNLL